MTRKQTEEEEERMEEGEEEGRRQNVFEFVSIGYVIINKAFVVVVVSKHL